MREGRINLDWLDAEMDNISIAVEELGKRRSEEKELSTVLAIDDRLTLLGHEYLVLYNLRKKCTPIEPPVFLSKTCLNNWESNKYCEKNGDCELCKLK